MNDAALLALASDLTQRAGKPAPTALSRLAGGKNNRVYRVALDGGEDVVLKLYHADPRDPRDRLGAEWGFLNYVWARGVRNVPMPLAQDRDRHAGLYGFVAGRRLAPDEIDAATVAAAADFVVAINAAPRQPDTLAPGSEACFSVADHLATVERRVARLDVLDPDAPLSAQAGELVATQLRPLWNKVRGEIEQAAAASGAALDAPIEDPCVSPSDFGFHNALVSDQGAACFIDFEYAGRDDPAKLACDFFCCPEVPVPLAFRASFVESVASGLGLGPSFQARCDALIDAYRIKWTCIILNDFLPVGAARRDFADVGSRQARCAAQLDKAAAKLAEIGLR